MLKKLFKQSKFNSTLALFNENFDIKFEPLKYIYIYIYIYIAIEIRNSRNILMVNS
jgi:hypothetical protein